MEPRITDFRWVVADRLSGTNRSASKCYNKKVCNNVFFPRLYRNIPANAFLKAAMPSIHSEPVSWLLHPKSFGRIGYCTLKFHLALRMRCGGML